MRHEYLRTKSLSCYLLNICKLHAHFTSTVSKIQLSLFLPSFIYLLYLLSYWHHSLPPNLGRLLCDFPMVIILHIQFVVMPVYPATVYLTSSSFLTTLLHVLMCLPASNISPPQLILRMASGKFRNSAQTLRTSNNLAQTWSSSLNSCPSLTRAAFPQKRPALF